MNKLFLVSFLSVFGCQLFISRSLEKTDGARQISFSNFILHLFDLEWSSGVYITQFSNYPDSFQITFVTSCPNIRCPRFEYFINMLQEQNVTSSPEGYSLFLSNESNGLFLKIKDSNEKSISIGKANYFSEQKEFFVTGMRTKVGRPVKIDKRTIYKVKFFEGIDVSILEEGKVNIIIRNE